MAFDLCVCLTTPSSKASVMFLWWWQVSERRSGHMQVTFQASAYIKFTALRLAKQISWEAQTECRRVWPRPWVQRTGQNRALRAVCHSACVHCDEMSLHELRLWTDKHTNKYIGVMNLLWKSTKLESQNLDINFVFATSYLYSLEQIRLLVTLSKLRKEKVLKNKCFTV